MTASDKAAFAELHALSNYTFLRGASHPEELIERAHALGYRALALTDECSVAGVVKAHVAAQAYGLHLIIGSEFRLDDPAHPEQPLHLVLLAPDRDGYTELCALISKGRRRGEKGQYRLTLADVDRLIRRCLLIWLPATDTSVALAQGERLKHHHGERLWLGVALLQEGNDEADYRARLALADTLNLPLVACNDVHLHEPARQPLADVLSAIRLRTPVAQLGRRLPANRERHLRPRSRLAEIYPAALLAESVAIAERCRFSLTELRYDYPHELLPAGVSTRTWLRQLVEQGARERWPAGTPPTVQAQLERELVLIAELRYEHYFFTVHDIVQFARREQILCQGRGSAANSAVCYCLGITEVDPARSQLLFERFLSRERNEPPDIDVDFEHERREEVIQYIYRKYGRDRAALAATVISYRPRSAIRDVGRALGIDQSVLDQLSRSLAWWDSPTVLLQRCQEVGLDPRSPVTTHFLHLLTAILGFPRHLSQHVGGFIIADHPIWTLVPIENAAMPERTIIQWDKDDIEALGLLKVDVLALGMLTAIRKMLTVLAPCPGAPRQLSDIPPEDPATYAMLSRGDSVGVFQVESRAQMAMLPRLKPKTFYDLVIEVAIVRPGPIQGDMVHPYLRRRNGEEAVDYPSPAIQDILERTLGIPIFQEQVIKLTMVAAGFSAGEADQLRRAMASWRKSGELEQFRDKLLNGMRERGYREDFAERIFKQIQGFGEYGFPESHAASFALLVYVSAWLKCHYPAAFYCGLLNSLPMGFYSPSQLIQDALRHRVLVHPPDVDHSHWDYSLEYQGTAAPPALRLGLRQLRGLSTEAVARLLQARVQAAFRNLQDLKDRAGLSSAELDALVRAHATPRLVPHRHQGQWEAAAIEQARPLLAAQEHSDPTQLRDDIVLPAPDATTNMLLDYRQLGLTLGQHPLALLRARHPFDRCKRTADLARIDSGRLVTLAGLVTNRQRPGTASGVLFMTLEDETGNANIVLWRDVQERYRQAMLGARLLMLKGIVEKNPDGVIHVLGMRLIDLSDQLPTLDVRSRDFH